MKIYFEIITGYKPTTEVNIPMYDYPKPARVKFPGSGFGVTFTLRAACSIFPLNHLDLPVLAFLMADTVVLVANKDKAFTSL